MATAQILRREAIVFVLALLERLLTPTTAWVLFEGGLVAKVIGVAALTATVTAYSFATKVFESRTEAELTGRVIEGLLAGDVLRASVLSGEDAHIELGQGIFSSAQALSQSLPTLAADLLSATILTVMIAIIEPPRAVAVMLLLTLVAAAALGWFRGRFQGIVIEAWRLQRRAYELVVDALEGRVEIVAAGARSSFLADATDRSRAWAQASRKVAGSAVLSGRLPLPIIAAIVGLAMVGDSHRGLSLSLRFSDLAFLAGVTPAFAGIANGFNNTVQSERWLRVVGQVIQGARAPFQGSREVSGRVADIRLETVSFRYEGSSEDALRDVSLSCKQGRLLALAGANGSGKSTCLRLLLALGAPRAGAIRIDGVDLGDLDVDAWRTQVAFLPQRPYLPPRSTVREAIRFLANEATDETIQHTLDRVGLTEALSRSGTSALDAPVDALSVGQRQRVALARMLCRNATVFLLDEPEANLDRAGIELVTEIVRDLAKEHIVVVAAHTPELLALADEVVVLDAGRVKTRPIAASAS